MARVVDSYTNILTVKLFARLADEDAYVRESIDEHQRRDAPRTCGVHHALHVLPHGAERALLVGTAAIGIWLWAQGAVERRRGGRRRCRSPGRSPTSPAG